MTPGLQAAIAGWKASGEIYFEESAGFGECRSDSISAEFPQAPHRNMINEGESHACTPRFRITTAKSCNPQTT